MGRHVPAVGNERDRAEQGAADNLGDHHESGERHDAPSAPLVLIVMRAEEAVILRPRIDEMRMHHAPSATARTPTSIRLPKPMRATNCARSAG